MDFPREELLIKYVRIYEQWIAPYEPDFEVAGGVTRYVRFNDAWSGLNPYNKLLIPRLTNRKNTFPKKPATKLAKNANPANYVTLKYDSEGHLKVARLGDQTSNELAFVYVSKQLTIGYWIDSDQNDAISHSLYNFEWYEYDDAGRLTSAEEFQGSGSPTDDVKMNCEYYEYDGDILSRAWQFKDFQKYPMQVTANLIRQMMPDRIYNPDQFEYTFQCVADGLDYACNHYYRKSQTLTHKDHVTGETLSHLTENGIRLV